MADANAVKMKTLRQREIYVEKNHGCSSTSVTDRPETASRRDHLIGGMKERAVDTSTHGDAIPSRPLRKETLTRVKTARTRPKTPHHYRHYSWRTMERMESQSRDTLGQSSHVRARERKTMMRDSVRRRRQRVAVAFAVAFEPNVADIAVGIVAGIVAAAGSKTAAALESKTVMLSLKRPPSSLCWLSLQSWRKGLFAPLQRWYLCDRLFDDEPEAR